METDKTTFWQKRRVFVTGATGLVGSWLVKRLVSEQAHVVVLIRDADPQSELYRSGDVNRVTVVNGRLEDFDTLARVINEQEVDTVFHLAAQPLVGVAHRYPRHTFETNIRGTYNLLEACHIHRQMVERVVIASSDKAYGTHTTLPYTEEMALQGKHPYEVSKSCADLLAQSYAYTYDLPLAIARCGNIYGGGDLNWSRIVPGTIRSLLQGERPVIRSDGQYVRDYIYVKDVVGAYIRLAEKLSTIAIQGQAFNFSPERPLTVLELVERIQKRMQYEHVTLDIQNNAVGEIRSQYLCADKAHEILNWQPQFTLDDSLDETIRWYRDFLAT